MGTRRIKIEGLRFDNVYVNEYIGDGKYRCTCDCGNQFIAKGQKLRVGSTKACRNCSGNGLIDISNQIFGEWKALKYTQNGFWLCMCSCGTIREVDGMRLRNGSSTNCGHIRDKNNLIDLKGKHFGEWEVLEHVKDDKWRCRCSCGNIKNVRSISLRDGTSKSCGHKQSKFIDLTNMRFGKLKVDRYIKSENKWECTCECGNKTKVYSANLRSKDTTSCGCEAHKYKVSTEQIVEFANINKLLYIDDIMQEFNISEKTARELVKRANLESKLDRQFGSKYERKIYSLIQKYTSNVIIHNRDILHGLELDIYLPDYKIAFEINGDYWHSSQFKSAKYHQNKTIECAKKGIRLIHIFEYEIINNEGKIYNFIENILGNSEIIYANKVTIESIDNNEYKDFLERYHLAGYSAASIKFGAFYNNELIGVMSFSSPRFYSECEYELVRLAYKNNKRIVGCTEKFISTFKKMYNPKNILSYCDISKFTGNGYTRCGFKVLDITKPNYVWVNIFDNHSVLSRYQVQSLVKQSGLPENELMTNNGYYKIYDSGNLKLILDLEEK